MTAAGGEVLAFKGINDFFHARLANYPANELNIGAVTTRIGICVQNILGRARLLGIGLGCAVVFKGNIAPHVRRAFKADGFKVIDLPRNPYRGS